MIAPYNDESTKREKLLSNYKENVLVMAGAGAGKTTMIVSRVINQLKNGWIKPSELVIITFTKAAAGELRDRLTLKLDSAYKKETDLKCKEILKEAIDNQALIQVSTIHSFCLRLIKERALDINYPLDVCMIDEIETKARKDLFFFNWIKNISDENKKLFDKYKKEFIEDDYVSFLYNMFIEIAELSKEIKIKYRSDLLNKNSNYYIDLMKHQANILIDKSNDYILLHKPTISESEIDLYRVAWLKSLMENINKKDKLFIKEYKDIYKNASKLGETTNIKVYEKEKNGGHLKLANGTKIRVKADLDYSDFDDLLELKNYYNEFSLYQNALVTDLAIRLQKDFQEYLEKPENKHKLSNDQLLNIAYELVSNHKDAREFFKSHIKYLYIDEYQDTDFIQRGLAYKLGQDDNGNFLDSRLFFCGDAKQAIYAFRGADLNVYQSTFDSFSKPTLKNSFVYSLQQNYRSEKTIIDWVNKEFASEHGIEAYEPMIPVLNGPIDDYILNGIYTLNVPNNKNDNKDKNAETESVFIAKLINYLIDPNNGFKLNEAIKDSNNKIIGYEARNIRYNDFLIISKGKKNLNILSDKLKYYNIPINMNGALNFKVDETIVKFKILYHYLINKNDKKAAFAAKQVLMQSALFTNKELANNRLEEFYKICMDKKPFELVEYLVHRSDLFMNKETPKGEVENIESRLQQMLEYLLSQDKLTFEGYDNELDKLMQSAIDKELSLSSDNNAVRIMNRHKSKGLQGKIVICSLRTKDKADSADSYRELKDNSYFYYPTAKNEGIAYPAYINREDSIQAIDRQKEKTRLEYVEATRAEECVIFLDNLSNTSSRFNTFNFSLDNGVKNLTNYEGIKDLYDNNYVKKTIIEAKDYEALDLKNNDVEVSLDSKQKEIKLESLTPSSLDNYDANGWSKVKKLDENRPDGNVFGTVLHRMFELVIIKIKNNELDYDLCLNQAMLESISDILKEERESYENYLKYQLDRFLKSKIIDLIKEAKVALPEYEFSYIDGNKWKNGKADLVLVYDNKILIIDYKTDKIPEGNLGLEKLLKHLEDAYGDQQRLYCEAMKKIFKIEDVSYSFYDMYS